MDDMLHAAPQMLKALKAILPFIEEDFPNGPEGPCVATNGYRQAYRDILAAIRKAEAKE